MLYSIRLPLSESKGCKRSFFRDESIREQQELGIFIERSARGSKDFRVGARGRTGRRATRVIF
jgi:hypothetical protein